MPERLLILIRRQIHFLEEQVWFRVFDAGFGEFLASGEFVEGDIEDVGDLNNSSK